MFLQGGMSRGTRDRLGYKRMNKTTKRNLHLSRLSYNPVKLVRRRRILIQTPAALQMLKPLTSSSTNHRLNFETRTFRFAFGIFYQSITIIINLYYRGSGGVGKV